MPNATFTPGQVLYTKGLNMACKPVVARVKFVRYLDKATEHGLDCVTESQGIRVMGKAADLRLTKEEVSKSF